MTITDMAGPASGSIQETVSRAATLSIASTGLPTVGGFTYPYAYRFQPGIAAAASSIMASRNHPAANRVIYKSGRFYLKLGVLPTGSDIIFYRANHQTAGADIVDVGVKTTGELIISINGTIVATSTDVLSIDTWYAIEVDVGYNAGAGARVYVDGVLWASISTGTYPTGQACRFGVVTTLLTTTNAQDVYLCGWVAEDDTLGEILGANGWALDASKPTGDSAVGGWKSNDGSTDTNLYDRLNETPPAATSSTANSDRIESVTNSATDNYDAICESYDAMGVPSDATIKAVMPMAFTAQATTTASPKGGSLALISNPNAGSDYKFQYGIPRDNNSYTAAAMGANFPTAWGRANGEPIVNPTVTRGDTITCRVGKRTATAQEVDVAELCVYVLWTPAVSGTQPKIKVAGAFTNKPIKVKIGGSWVEKQLKVKVGGSFVNV